MGVLFGIDVSNGQGSIDFRKVKESGVSFVIAKATEGHTFLDAYYWANKTAIRDAGMVPGAYHFLRPGNGAPVDAQADWFCKFADPDAIHALDVEGAGPLDVIGWMKAYRKHYPTKTVLIYTGPYMWKNISKVPYDGAQFGPLWAAGYKPNRYVSATGSLENQWKAVTGNCDLPWLGWSTWTIMQFTDHAKVPGVAGGVDGNAFGGTLDDLKKLAARDSQEDDHMSAQDVENLKAYIDSKMDDIASAVWGKLIESNWNGKQYAASRLLSRAEQYSIDGGWPYDRPEGNDHPNTPTNAKLLHAKVDKVVGQTDTAETSLAALQAVLADVQSKTNTLVSGGVTASVDQAALTTALAAALQTANADTIRAVLVDVLEKTRLSATPPSA